MRIAGFGVVVALSYGVLLDSASAQPAAAESPPAPPTESPPAESPPAASFDPVPLPPADPLPPAVEVAADVAPAPPVPEKLAPKKVPDATPGSLRPRTARMPTPKTRADASDKNEESFVPFALAFGIEGGFGANGRIDGGPSGFADKDRFDTALSIGAWAEPERKWSYGIEYARTGLGAARSLPTADSVTVAYTLDTLWAKARYFPWRETKYRGYAGLGLGLSLEEVRANGTRESSMPFNLPPQVFACSALSHPTVSLGASAGMNVDLERHLAFLFQVEAAAQPITGDVVGECAVASGSVLNAVARLGFAYKFDATDSFIDGHSAPQSARR